MLAQTDWTRFLAEFIQKPLATGSVIPSSSYLARTMIRQAALRNADTVLEFGPGTGVFTPYILEQLGTGSKFAAIEVNPRLAAVFRAAHPGVRLFEDSVENVRAICDSMRIEQVDCVISGLPWAFFSESMQIRILGEMIRVLRPGGKFVTFGYVHSLRLPGARYFAGLLRTHFRKVSKSSIVWRNVPPAFVYRCLC
jgi:phosphatidylethanolamine/phosphatidyl-N-methylethanolamine N-methyltransferase